MYVVELSTIVSMVLQLYLDHPDHAGAFNAHSPSTDRWNDSNLITSSNNNNVRLPLNTTAAVTTPHHSPVVKVHVLEIDTDRAAAQDIGADTGKTGFEGDEESTEGCGGGEEEGVGGAVGAC